MFAMPSPWQIPNARCEFQNYYIYPKNLGHTRFYRRLHFFRESIRNLRSTGSVAPSSRFLCQAMVSKMDPEQARIVIELGPGDGVITHFILERLKPGARLLIFEINATFVNKIRSTFNDPRLTVIHDSAEHIGKYLEDMDIDRVDYVVSALPFTTLPEALTWRIVRECHRWLRPGGRFIQFHYSPILLSFYRRIFGNISVQVVPLNIPPAIVLTCEKTSS